MMGNATLSNLFHKQMVFVYCAAIQLVNSRI